MHYVVMVRIAPEEGTPDLDRLQVAGAALLTERGLEDFAHHGVIVDTGPSDLGGDAEDTRTGYLVTMRQVQTHAHPGGIDLLVGLDAATVEMAEGAMEVIVQECLEGDNGFEGWTILSCEVQFDDETALKLLAAADGPEALPDDLVARQARLAAPTQDSQREGEREMLLGKAEQMRAFPLTAFLPEGTEADPSGPEALACGAVMHATETIMAGLFNDLSAVQYSAEGTVGSCDLNELDAVMFLPAGYLNRYTEGFVRRFIVCASVVTARLASSDPWPELASPAEALALQLVIQEAEWLLGRFKLDGPEDWQDHLLAAIGLVPAWEDLVGHTPSMVDELDPPDGLPDWFLPVEGRSVPLYVTSHGHAHLISATETDDGSVTDEDELGDSGDWDAAAQLLGPN